MKKIAVLIMFIMPLTALGQNVWEKPKDTATESVK